MKFLFSFALLCAGFLVNAQTTYIKCGKLIDGKNDQPLANELAHLRLRYKEPEGNVSKLLEWPLQRSEIQPDMTHTSERLRFAAAVAGFGQMLKGGKYTANFSYGDVAKLARSAQGDDRFGYRREFLSLVQLAESLSTATPQARQLSLQHDTN